MGVWWHTPAILAVYSKLNTLFWRAEKRQDGGGFIGFRKLMNLGMLRELLNTVKFTLQGLCKQ